MGPPVDSIKSLLMPLVSPQSAADLDGAAVAGGTTVRDYTLIIGERTKRFRQ
jgi:hypothetical protein